MQDVRSIALFCAERVAARLGDVVHLTGAIRKPETFTKTLAARARAVLTALEAMLRRALLVLAFEVLPGLDPSTDWHNPARGRARKASTPRTGFRLLPPPPAPFPDSLLADPWGDPPAPAPGPVPAAPILARLSALARIAANPDASARRLAYILARQKEDIPQLPGPFRLKARDVGTEISALYPALAGAIVRGYAFRPAPVGPRPPPPPRLRQL